MEAGGIIFRSVFLHVLFAPFSQHVVHFWIIFGGVSEVFGEPWTSENHAKVYNYMHFHALDPLGAESVSGSASGRGLGCVFQDFGFDWGTHWASVWAVLAADSGSDFGGGFWQATRTKISLKCFARRQGRGL